MIGGVALNPGPTPARTPPTFPVCRKLIPCSARTHQPFPTSPLQTATRLAYAIAFSWLGPPPTDQLTTTTWVPRYCAPTSFLLPSSHFDQFANKQVTVSCFFFSTPLLPLFFGANCRRRSCVLTSLVLLSYLGSYPRSSYVPASLSLRFTTAPTTHLRNPQPHS
jgi:hypothetical protein